MVEPIIRNYNKKTHKKCIKCRAWKPRFNIWDKDETEGGVIVAKKAFGDHPDSGDGLQSICYLCKNQANADKRNKDVKTRLRHHIATRCLTHLGDLAPEGFTRDLEDYLGYKIAALVRHLRTDLRAREGEKRKLLEALNEGYHIDHIRPLSSFRIIVPEGSPLEDFQDRIDWGVFKECWAMDNLTAIPADENLAKGASYDESTVPTAIPGAEGSDV